MSDKPIFVPIALPLNEARATLGAVRYAFHQATTLGLPVEMRGELARAMVTIAHACDKACEEAAA
jgi:hypothetical protein